MSEPSDPLLSVRNLRKYYPITRGVLQREDGEVRAVDGIDFEIDRGETFGLVGESGCGKSTVAETILRLEEPTAGSVRFDGEEVIELTGGELQRFRRRTGVVFQDPDASLDPRMTVGESVAEPLVIHGLRDRGRRREIVERLLVSVGLTADDADRFPHEFSGGQKQRIALARALVVDPDLLVADEPVSSLDVSIQAEILSLLADLQRSYGLSILFISHDLSIVRAVCDRVGVMYLGELVEVGPADDVFADPAHPYTQTLVSAIPTADPRDRGGGNDLDGDVPEPSNPPSGCRFHTRCPEVIQPDGLDLERDTWRAIVDLVRAVETERVDVAAVRETVATETPDIDDPASVPRSTVVDRILVSYDVPTLTATAAGEELRDAIATLERGDRTEALTRLRTTFGTVCRTHAPEACRVGPGRRVACHLHDRPDGDDSMAAGRTSGERISDESMPAKPTERDSGEN